MAALLVAMSVMAVFMTVAIPVWNTQAKREKEAELVFRGEQYARAVMLYQRKFANALPPSLDILLNDQYLRKKYKDPITGGDFQLLSGASVQANAGVPGGQVAGQRRARWHNDWSRRQLHGHVRRRRSRRSAVREPRRPRAADSSDQRRLRSWRGCRLRRRRHRAGRHHGRHEHQQREVAAALQRPRRLQRVDVRAGAAEPQRRCRRGGADTPGGAGRGGRGRGAQPQGRGEGSFRPGGGTGGPGSSPFRPPTGTFGNPQTQPGGGRQYVAAGLQTRLHTRPGSLTSLITASCSAGRTR